MKSKITAVLCFTVVAILALPVNVCAIDPVLDNESAWTDDSSYDLNDPVEIGATWDVIDNDHEIYFSHTAAAVYMRIRKQASSLEFTYYGWWRLGEVPLRGGDVYVTAYVATGDASYTWDSSEGSTGTWYVNVEVHAWDNLTNYPDPIFATGMFDSPTFTLN